MKGTRCWTSNKEEEEEEEEELLVHGLLKKLKFFQHLLSSVDKTS